MSDGDHSLMLAENRIEDAHNRLRYQQEFSAQGFRTLTLINGGAIIALLTYTGHSEGSDAAPDLANAFLAYTAGLVTAVSAYLAAYLSQASLMNADMMEAYRLLGIEPVTTKTGDELERTGMLGVKFGIGLSIASLLAFITGSWLALLAIS
ncbi:MAG TPA: hypothetical protein VMN38_10355 [Sphingomicrobium sp.]|nr:hypothetical protein [Sphingomicrobium sp.]